MNTPTRIAAAIALFVPLVAATSASATLSQSWQLGSPAQPTVASPSPPQPGAWFDTVGPENIFDTVYIDIVKNGGVTITAYTNFPINYAGTLGGRTVRIADLAIDLDGDGSFEYGVATTAHDGLTQGTLYSVTDWTTSREIYNNPALNPDPFYGGAWDECPGGAPCTDPKVPNVLINTGAADPNGTGTVTQRGRLASDPDYGKPYLYVLTWDLPSANVGDRFASAAFYWGTADCANDSIYVTGNGGGDIPNPEPVSLALFGFGLVALGAAATRARARG